MPRKILQLRLKEDDAIKRKKTAAEKDLKRSSPNMD
jgi:hypothetical protein